jgi:hypothetical protein
LTLPSIHEKIGTLAYINNISKTMNDEQRQALQNLLDYTLENEAEHYEESDQPAGHIYHQAEIVTEWLNKHAETLNELDAGIAWDNWRGEGAKTPYFTTGEVLNSRIEGMRDYFAGLTQEGGDYTEEEEEAIETLDMLQKYIATA